MHPNIVKLYDVFETERYIGIIMEYASGKLLILSFDLKNSFMLLFYHKILINSGN